MNKSLIPTYVENFLRLAACLAIPLMPLAMEAQSNEYRGFWADAFHPGFNNKKEVSKLIADVRAANCNTIVFEARKRGDAFYMLRIFLASYFWPIWRRRPFAVLTGLASYFVAE